MDDETKKELKACPYCGMKSERARKHLVNCFFSYLNDGKIDEALSVYNVRPIEDALNARCSELEQMIENAKGKITKIILWLEAYPLEVWPELDWDKVKELLGNHLLSCVSASNMRHVVISVKEIAADAFHALEEQHQNQESG